MVLLGGVNEYIGAAVTHLARPWEDGVDEDSSETDMVWCLSPSKTARKERLLLVWTQGFRSMKVLKGSRRT